MKMKNLMKALIGSGLFGVMMMLSACGSSNNDTTNSGLMGSSCSSSQYGTLTYNATCSQYGNYGLATNGQCVPATSGTCTNTTNGLGTGSCSSATFGALTYSATCAQYGNYGLASNGQCEQATSGTCSSQTLGVGTIGTGTMTGTACTQQQMQMGYVTTQIGCIPYYNPGICRQGYTYGQNPQNGQPWCFPIF